mmetsp:Transcript_31884/g.69779  ORF Transcript_31884/g.69779 Transcript_31884/m.69779 type:complete len:854 (+) Transcript_31884:97-2658(+)
MALKGKKDGKKKQGAGKAGQVKKSKKKAAKDDFASFLDEDDEEIPSDLEGGSEPEAAPEFKFDSTVLNKKAQQAKKRVLIPTGPETEAGLDEGEQAISTEDLLKGLDSSLHGDLRKQLTALTKEAPLRADRSSVKAERAEREVAYKEAAKEIGKWQPQVDFNKDADQVVMGPLGELKMNTGDLAKSFEPENDFENELQQAIEEAGLTGEQVKNAKALPAIDNIARVQQINQVRKLKQLMLQEATRNKRLSKIKSRAFRRIHNRADRREQQKLLERLDEENPELAAELRLDAEKRLANLRSTRQARARRRWAKAANRFGGADSRQEISRQAQMAHDERRALERAVKGKPTEHDADSEDEQVDFSGSDEEAQAGGTKATLARAKVLTLREMQQQTEAEMPTTGVLGMKFMREAIKAKREAATEEAKKLLKELEEAEEAAEEADSEDNGRTRGKKVARKAHTLDDVVLSKPAMQFSRKEMMAAEAEIADVFNMDDDAPAPTDERTRVSAPLDVKPSKITKTLKKSLAEAAEKAAADPANQPRRKRVKELPAAEAAGDPGSDGEQEAKRQRVDGEEEGDANEEAGGAADAAPAAAEANPFEAMAQAGVTELKDEEAAKEAPPAPNPWAPERKKVARPTMKTGEDREKKNTWAGEVKEDDELSSNSELSLTDDEESESEGSDMFEPMTEDAAQQRALIKQTFARNQDVDPEYKDSEDEKAASDSDDGLPGWGAGWVGDGVQPRKKTPKAAAKPVRKRPKLVQYSKKVDQQAQKYMADRLPNQVKPSPEAYTELMKMPVGREWNTSEMHKHWIQPKVWTRVGAVVPPLALAKRLPEEQRNTLIGAWTNKKVVKRTKTRL